MVPGLESAVAGAAAVLVVVKVGRFLRDARTQARRCASEAKEGSFGGG